MPDDARLIEEAMEALLEKKELKRLRMYPAAIKKLDEICKKNGWKDGELLSVLVLKEYKRLYPNKK